MTKTTTVATSASDTLELGLLGFAALVAFTAIFYDRLSKITGPGGWGLEFLTPPVRQALASSVVSEASRRTRKAALAAGDHLTTADALADPSPIVRLHRMARSEFAFPDAQVFTSSEEGMKQIARATSLATRYAEDLLRLTGRPDALRAEAVSLGISDEQEIADLHRGIIRRSVSNRLANRALTEVGIPE